MPDQSDERPPVAPRDAATVILLRESEARAEALLVRRHANLAFMGGTWVFPGGKVAAADSSAQALRRCVNVSDRQLDAVAAAVPKSLSRENALGLFFAACRETFEETGILLAQLEDGSPCDAKVVASVQCRRAGVARDAALFARLLEELDLVLDPTRFVYWAHWITPSIARQRFDARFFIVSVPPDQVAQCDSGEITELLWLDLRSFGDLPDESFLSAPPTRFSLADLAGRLGEHGSIKRLLTMEARRYVPAMIPRMTRVDGQATAVLPWDSSYCSLPGDGTPSDVVIPERFLGLPSRVLARHEIRAAEQGPAP